MKVEAHAKVNLTLEVLGVRPDGYHDLRSVVLPIPLCDDIELTPADDLAVAFAPEGLSPATLSALAALPPEKNLAWKAARVLQQATGCSKGVQITITKRIPAGAGMGGGSSDAAAVLNALNDLWELHLPKPRLCELAAEVGSDVPALTWGGPVLMEGRGERVTPLAESPLKDFPLPDVSRLVVYTPPVFVSTPAVFREFREDDRGKGANDLQPAACRLHPEISAALQRLVDQGCEGVMMSGSGATVFGFRPSAA